MKKSLLVLITTLAVLFALTATAERKIWMYSSDGNHLSMDVTKMDSISFVEPGMLVLNPESKVLGSSGGRFTVSVTANKPWTASVNDPTALTISKTSGKGDDQINVSATANADTKSYSAILTVTLEGGMYKQTIVTVDGITETLSVSPTTKSFDSKGGQFSISVSSNTAWSVTSNQTWATLSTASGSGDGSVTVTVAENKTTTSDNATITIKTSTKTSTVSISRSGTTPPLPAEKCKASDYAQVTIGTQTWMAENYRCSTYDTESEAYNASWLTDNTLPTSSTNVYTPYYTDASDKSNWYETTYAGKLTDAHVDKLGYLYNWAAAVGVEEGSDYGKTPFTGNRQGICPNGWHIPSKAEWSTLANYIDGNYGMTDAGKKLKTTSGWFNNGNGTDTYGFAALPAGYAYGSSVPYVGGYTYFWTATPDESGSAYYRFLYYSSDYLYSSSNYKNIGHSVRCLRD